MPLVKLEESELLILNDTLGMVNDGEVGVERGKRGDFRELSEITANCEYSRKGKERPLRPEEEEGK